MITSDNGLKLIKAAEFCELSAYPDPASPLGKACSRLRLPMRDYRKVPRWQLLKADPITIGWGHTGTGYRLGDSISQETADSLLRMDVHFAEYALHMLELNQNQFDALVSFVFNVGGAAIRDHDIGKYLRAKDYAAAADEFVKWDHANGQVNQGLLNRRKSERALFLTPITEREAV